MAGCHDMKKGQRYMCEDCGVEIQVVRGYDDDDSAASDDMHTMSRDAGSCSFVCCYEKGDKE